MRTTTEDRALRRRDVATWDGYRAASFARSTGTLVALLDADLSGYSVEDGGRWVTVCVDHDSDVQHETVGNARGWMPAPEMWCECCAERVRFAAELAAARSVTEVVR